MATFSFGFARHKMVKALVYGLVLCAMVLGLSLAPGNAGSVQAAGRWCTVTPSRIFQKGWQKYPTDPNFVMIWNGRNLTEQIGAGKVYTYFNGQWIGLSWHGYFNDSYGRYNQWGIPTWMPGKYPRTWNNVSYWKINFWSPDGGCGW